MVIERKGLTIIAHDGMTPSMVVGTLALVLADLSAEGIDMAAQAAMARRPVAAKEGPTPRPRAFVAAEGTRVAVSPVVYRTKPNFDKAKAKALTASNAKVMGALRATRGGLTTRDIAKATGVNAKTVQSNVYQLRHAGLIESHRVGA